MHSLNNVNKKKTAKKRNVIINKKIQTKQKQISKQTTQTKTNSTCEKTDSFQYWFEISVCLMWVILCERNHSNCILYPGINSILVCDPKTYPIVS